MQVNLKAAVAGMDEVDLQDTLSNKPERKHSNNGRLRNKDEAGSNGRHSSSENQLKTQPVQSML